MTIVAQPKYFTAGEGKIYRLGRITLTFKTGAEDNAGAYTLCEAIEPPESGAGLHRHATYDETHIICEGAYECRLGDRLLKLGPGDMMFAPKGTAHSIKSIGPQTGRELIISSPGGIFDAFIHDVATAQAEGSVDFRAIAAKYGIEFLS
jgi:mannose-6-phosphate isomerase-like protein (cupin superfamily)